MLATLGNIAAPAWNVAQAGAAFAAQPPPQDEPGGVRVVQPVVYTALGDSIATGLWSSAGYVDRYAERLRADVSPSAQLTNLAVNGWTTGDLLNALRSNETYRGAVRGSDVITISIGGNDLLQARGRYVQGACGGQENDECLQAATDRLLANWDAILDEVQALIGPRPAVIRTMDVYNSFVAADDSGQMGVLKPYLDEANSSLCLSAETRGIPCARVYAAFNGPDGTDDPIQRSLITFDGIHPSELGHALIADLLGDLAFGPLR